MFHLNQIKFDDPRFNRNFLIAVELFTKSASQGHTQAQLSLGRIYLSGITSIDITIDKDISLGIMWLTKAAEQNEAHAQFHLGRCYIELCTEYLDHDKGLELLKMSAKNGDEFAPSYLQIIRILV